MTFIIGAYSTRRIGHQSIQSLLDIENENLRVFNEGRLMIWAGQPRLVGMGAVIIEMKEKVLCGYGDRLPLIPQGPPAGADTGQVLEWSRTSFLRFSGALCSASQLILWTDESAACPLFYTFDDSGAPVFSSEAKLLLIFPSQQRRLIDPNKVRPIPDLGNTVFAGVYAVPPGAIIIFARNKHNWTIESFNTYFELPSTPHLIDLDQSAVKLAKALDLAVAQCVQGLDEINLTLSGGVDSSSIAALACKFTRTVHSFTVGTPFGDEFVQAREVADLLKLDHHELMMKPEDLASLLPKLIWTMETWDPLTLEIAAAVAFLYEKLGSRDSFFLTGYGADLIFAGVVDRSLAEPDLEQAILHQVRLTIPTNEFTPAFANRCGITVRYPFWRPEMLCLALNIRARLKVTPNEVKYVFRRGMESLLPHSVAWRPKKGIHEGTAMSRMFSEVLNVNTGAEKAMKLRKMAVQIFEELADGQNLLVERAEEHL